MIMCRSLIHIFLLYNFMFYIFLLGDGMYIYSAGAFTLVVVTLQI